MDRLTRSWCGSKARAAAGGGGACSDLRTFFGTIAFGLALAAIQGCRARHHEPQPACVNVQVEFAGCSSLSEEGRCGLPAGSSKLRLWVDVAGPATARWRTDRGDLASELAPSPSGQLHVVSVDPTQTHTLSLTLGPSSCTVWQLAIDRVEEPSWSAEAKRLRKEGKLNDALAALNAQVALAGERKGSAVGLQARILLQAGRTAEAIAAFESAIELHRRSHWLSEEVDDTLALAFARIERSSDFAGARRDLAGLSGRFGRYDEGRARAPYYEGLLALRTGDFYNAFRLLREAEQRALRLGSNRLALMTQDALTQALFQAGLVHRGLERVRQSLHSPLAEVGPCDRAVVAANAAATIVSAQAQNREADGIGSLLDEAEKLFVEATHAFESTCADPVRLAAALLGSAELALLRGDRARAGELLAKARLSSATATSELALGVLWLEAWIERENERWPRALQVVERGLRRACSSGAFSHVWNFRLEQAAVLESMGRTEDALAVLLEADRSLDSLAAQIPATEGRHAALAGREAAARGAVRLLLERGRVDDALRVGRHARARALRTIRLVDRLERLSQADRLRWDQAIGRYHRERRALDELASGEWKLSQAELRQRGPLRTQHQEALQRALNEAMAVHVAAAELTARAERPTDLGMVWLLVYPTDREWVAIAATRKETLAVRLPASDPAAVPSEAWASSLLDPLARLLSGATHLRVFLHRSVHKVDFHELRWQGRRLGERLAVSYGLDVGAAGASLPPDPGAVAVVVSDPTGDLPSSAEEGSWLRTWLSGHSPFDVRWQQGESATAEAVRGAFESAWFVHYAGHSFWLGQEGLRSGLRLAGKSRLEVGDFLSLKHTPRWVFLSSCEAAKGSVADAEGLDVAQALAIAGARAVVAPTRPVNDRLAAELAPVFYPFAAEGGWTDPAVALAKAQAKLRETAPERDWSAYRVLVP